MAEKAHESTQFRMTRLANLGSMAGHDYMELVWENGQLLMPVLSAAASCTSYSPHSPKAPVNNNDRDIITKRPRLENVDSSILGDFPGDRELNKHDSSLQNGLPGLYETNFNMFQETTKNNTYDKHITESHVVPVHKTANSRSGKPSKFVAQIPRFTTPRNDQLHSSSVEQRQASAPFGRPMVNTSQTQVSVDGLPNSLPWPDSGPDKHLALQNFSLFLRPATLLKANGKSSGATRPTSCQNSSRLEQLKSYNEKPPASGTNPVELTLAEPAGGSKISKGFQENQTDPERTNMEPTRPIAKPPEEAPLDEQSQAIVHKDAFASKRCSDQVLVSSSSLAANKIKAKPDTGNSTCQLAPATSICSRGASNYPTCSLKRSYEDTEGMPYPSKHANEKQAGATEVMPARGSAGAKRRRTAKVHKLSERRRRDKINKKMRALQELVPNSNKVDKASMLDEAIEYLKTLQRQVQIMSMGTGICMPSMMLPTGMQHIYAPHLAQISPMGTVGMGMRMNTGVGFSPVPFSTSAMLGLPGHMPPMSVSRPPFIPLIGGQSAHPVPMPGISGLSIPFELLGSASLSNPKYVAQNFNPGLMNIGNIAGSKTQSSSQAFEASPTHQTLAQKQ